MAVTDIDIRKVWRSEIKGIIVFLFLCFATVFLSRQLPFTVIRGEILPLENSSVYLRLPLLWFLPAYVLGTLLFRIYDVQYIFSSQGVEARSGIISLHTVRTKIRYEDMISVEVVQGIFDRLLKVGILEISTSATGGIEIIMEGVADPISVQNTLLNAREMARKNFLQEQPHGYSSVTRNKFV